MIDTATPEDTTSAPAALTTGIETLGHANRFAVWDSEFRYDGRLRVPVGVRITKVRYAYYGNDKAETEAVRLLRGSMGVDQQYEVIDLTFLADSDVITFTLRGDLNVDAAPDKGQYSKTYPILVRVDLSNGETRTASPQVEVLWPEYIPDQGRIGRPFVRLPWDYVWGGNPNSQAGFGYVADSGYIPGDKLIVDLVNPRQGRDVPGSHSDFVYYQLVHEDGTPSHLTTTPRKLKVEGHADAGTSRKQTLGAIDLREAGDKPGYYRFLVWPQATDPSGEPSATSWDPSRPGDAFQVGSLYYRYTAPHSAQFSVRPGGPPDVRLDGDHSVGYPGVRLEAQDGPVPPQTVRVTLPQGMGLQFVEEGNPGYQLTVQDADGTVKPYPGRLSGDGQTLTFDNVDLDLLTRGSRSTIWVAVKATDTTTAARTSLTFHVGNQSSQSTPIEVT
ncbi:hypothetical protein LXH13_38560 [Streptomyces spinosirectus]|uniref:hypothetical protein n=1 Tax=Streptomyces TaxID=1883 RepID=UPI000D397243|nr:MULTISPECIES: hypothetical protein [Streptomyces]MBY8343412.1 hypothetical protein [Streptomyces plumbidurans]PTM86547.1 hypothetical protein C7821_11767 [Streptomyces sp. VMFN-G11Ma]UIR22591.1 hypothetical protein LXH13_38560 [Streptomyces spinosirectus]